MESSSVFSTLVIPQTYVFTKSCKTRKNLNYTFISEVSHCLTFKSASVISIKIDQIFFLGQPSDHNYFLEKYNFGARTAILLRKNGERKGGGRTVNQESVPKQVVCY